jgi:DNA polymerase-3 subunit delta
MRLKPNQLTQHLNRQGLAPLYLLTGDEPLQMMESADILRQFARKQGFIERIIFTVETGFDWSSLNQEAESLSLFANKRLLELRLSNKSPGNEGTKALINYTNNLPRDTVLLITADKIEASKQKTKWFKALDERGIILQIWPLNRTDLPKWIAQRLKNYKLQATPEAINIIAERSEGHLLACSQEIEKLYLLYGSGQIDIAQIFESVTDSARFQVFDWVDTVLVGNVQRSVRQLQRLKTEGIEAILVNWALNREIRNLYHITYAIKSGQNQQQVFKNYRIWATRQAAIAHAINKHRTPRQWQKFLQKTVEIERIIKGMKTGNVWDELQQLSLRVAGVKLF